MNRKNTLAALIAATAILASANSAQAFGWSWSWFTLNIIAPNNIVAPPE